MSKKVKLSEREVKALDASFNEHIIFVISLYHKARIKAKRCPDLVLENRGNEAANRMRDLYDLEDQLFMAADYLEGEIGEAIIEYREAKEELQFHPGVYKSQDTDEEQREQVVKLFNKMYDKESEMFKLAGIDYHEYS